VTTTLHPGNRVKPISAPAGIPIAALIINAVPVTLRLVKIISQTAISTLIDKKISLRTTE
jgi:hypothetical protein